MSVPAGFVLAMAWRDGRASLRRLWVLVACLSVGVAALVAIHSFTVNLLDSVHGEARALMGADLALGSANRFSTQAETTVAALIRSARGAQLSRVTRFAAMAYLPRGSRARLVQVTAVDGGYPFYGRVGTDPPGEWEHMADDRGAVVDPAVLATLDARVGDTLALGEARFVIRGTIADFPGDVGVRTALGPRVFIAARHLPDTALLGFGARARHDAYVRLPPGADAERIARRHRPSLAVERVTLRTVADNEESLGENIGRLGRYLGLVALAALLLGGLGVASAVHVLIKRKLPTIAVLRCLGATTRQLLAVYLLQTSVLGLLGSVIGAGLGIGVQLGLPSLLTDVLPVDVRMRVSWPAVAAGCGLGLWVASIFSLVPLLSIRRVSPLLVLRRPYEDAAPLPRDPWRAVATLALGASIVVLALVEAPGLLQGLAFAGGIGATLGALWLSARGLTWVLRRRFGSGGPYVWRQGIANLFRPANQTVTVVLALGFGAFLLDTIFVVQHNLLAGLRTAESDARPNLVLFDIQPDQREPVEAALVADGFTVRPAVPVVPMRVVAVKGRPVADVLAQAASVDRAARPRGLWALRREYRSTYRDGLASAEKRVAGEGWRRGAWKGRRVAEGEAVPISLETGLAGELRVGLGDEIVWDVQGLSVRSRVAQLRDVAWARFEPNFFVVFPEGALDGAPEMFVTLARNQDAAARARLQRRLVEAFPNVTTLDVSQVQQAVDLIVDRVALVVRFMAFFSLATGAIVLMGAVATSRYQRLREAVLLKTLGATRGQLLRISVAEYASLGALGAAAAVPLASGAGWALVRFVLETPFTLPLGPLVALAASLVILTVCVGIGNNREVFRKPPLEALRAE